MFLGSEFDAVVDFTMTQLLDGTTVVEIVFITSLRMEIMCLWNLTRCHLDLAGCFLIETREDCVL
jgi:hypothetical protein